MKVCATFLLIPAMAFAGSSSQGQLDWLAGCWVAADGTSQEVWVADGEHAMIGFSASLDAGSFGFYEVLSIKRNEAGKWVYAAHPSGQEPASFDAVETTGNRVVFANPDHDYPQEISYQREGNKLFASISLLGGGKARSFDKIACE